MSHKYQSQRLKQDDYQCGRAHRRHPEQPRQIEPGGPVLETGWLAGADRRGLYGAAYVDQVHTV